jgi:hypothetical protein
MLTLEYLNQNKIALATVPVITYMLFIIYSFIIHFPTGVANLLLSVVGLPLTIIGQVIVFFLLKAFFSKESNIPVYVLGLNAVLAIVSLIYKMATFKKVKVTKMIKPSPPKKK